MAAGVPTTAGHRIARPKQGQTCAEPAVAQVQDQDERLGNGRQAAPAREPGQQAGSGDDQQAAGEAACRGCDPRQNGDGERRHCRMVEPAHRRRLSTCAALEHPVAGEARHDAAADQRHQYEHGPKADPPPQFAGRQAQCSGLRQRAADSEARQQRQDRQVAPAFAGHDLAQGKADQDHAEADINCGRKPRAGCGTNEIEATRRGPEEHQTKQRQTADRRPAGPVRYRGQQEAGQHAARVAEQHLMLMPGERIEREREAHHTGEHPQPQSQGQRSPERGPKKERAETLPKDSDTQ